MAVDDRDTLPPPPPAPVEVVDDAAAFAPGRRLRPIDTTKMTDGEKLDLVVAETYGLSNALHRMFGLFSVYSTNYEELVAAIDEIRGRLARIEGIRR